MGKTERDPPPPFPLTRRATADDVGGSKPQRKPSVHSRRHAMEVRHWRVQDLLEADDATIREWSVGGPPGEMRRQNPPTHGLSLYASAVKELPRRPAPPQRAETR